MRSLRSSSARPASGRTAARMASDASRVTVCTWSMCSGSSPRISLIGRYSRSLRICPSARSTGVGVPDAVRARVDRAHAVLGARDRVDDRAREQPVEQQELGGVAGARHAAVGAQVRLVGAARAQDGRPRRAGCLGQRPRREQARRHVGALDAASEREELPGLVAARRRVDDADGERRALAHPLEELVHLLGLQAPRHPRARRVEGLPQLGRDDLARAAGVLAGGGERRRRCSRGSSGRRRAARARPRAGRPRGPAAGTSP